MMVSLVPPPALPGDTVGIIAPAGNLFDRARFDAGIIALEAMGYNARYPREFWPGSDYLSDIDERRGQECNAMFAAPEVKAIIALRGGFGCLRMLHYLDLDLISKNPKLLVGFSDISLLQNHLHAHIGLLSLHGPVLTSLGDADESARLRLTRCLAGFWDDSIPLPHLEVLRSGEDTPAPLFGGNLANLASVLGTPYDFSWDGKILFLEDINEPLYRIDRMLTQLFLAGKFDRLAGVLLGDFSGVYEPGDNRQQRYLESIWTRVLELCRDGRFPIWANIPAGHRSNNQTLPFGSVASVDCEARLLCFRQPVTAGLQRI